MKNEINAVLENMTTTIPEPEDYTGEDGLLYCGKCRKPKEAYFAPDKAAIFGRDRHPAECDCQRAAREEREAAEKRRRHLDTVEELKRRGFTDRACPPVCGALGRYADRQYRLPVLGRRRHRQKLPCRLYRKRPHGERNPRPHDELCSYPQ